jgi:outer membrane protein assembly factor BamB
MWMCAALLLSATPLIAKRSAPEPVPPVVVGGIEYSAPGWPIGFIVVTDTRTGREIWRKRIYRIKIDPALERDVQDVFIASLTLAHGNLFITDERGRRYALELSTRKVTRLPDPLKKR